MARIRKRKSNWLPESGKYASYGGRYSRLLRGGKLVVVIAEASGMKTVVEAIGDKGIPVRLTVKTENLIQPQPSLFDYY